MGLYGLKIGIDELSRLFYLEVASKVLKYDNLDDLFYGISQGQEDVTALVFSY